MTFRNVLMLPGRDVNVLLLSRTREYHDMDQIRVNDRQKPDQSTLCVPIKY